LKETEEALGGSFDDDPLAGDKGFVILAGESPELDVATTSHAVGGVANATGEIEDVRGYCDDLHSDASGWIGFGKHDQFVANGGLLKGEAFGLEAHDTLNFLTGAGVVLLDDESGDGLAGRHDFTPLIRECGHDAIIGSLEEAMRAALFEKHEATVAGTFVLLDFIEAGDGTLKVGLYLGDEFGLHGAALFEDCDFGLEGAHDFPIRKTTGKQALEALELAGKDGQLSGIGGLVHQEFAHVNAEALNGGGEAAVAVESLKFQFFLDRGDFLVDETGVENDEKISPHHLLADGDLYVVDTSHFATGDRLEIELDRAIQLEIAATVFVEGEKSGDEKKPNEERPLSADASETTAAVAAGSGFP